MSEETKTTELTPQQKLEQKIRELRNQHYQCCATLGDFQYMLDSLPKKITQAKDKIRTLIEQIESAEAKFKPQPVTPAAESPTEKLTEEKSA